MLIVNVLIFITFFLLNCDAQINEKCTINLGHDMSVRPEIKVNFGTKYIIIPSHIDSIYISESETVYAYCNHGYENPKEKAKVIALECRNGHMYCANCTFEEEYYYNRHQYSNIEGNLRCVFASMEWNLYEITPSFTFCSNYETSYVIGKSKFNNTEIILGLCYNLHQMKLGTVIHTSGISGEYISELFKNFTISMEIHNGLQYFRREKFEIKDVVLKKWLDIFGEYDLDWLIPKLELSSDSIVSIPWWRNLRLGNWHKYQKALRERSRFYGYEMLTGTTGRLEVLIENTCNYNVTMKLAEDSIPLYIWNYIKSEEKPQDKYIIVGINSPFYEFYKTKDLIFCKDICQEIDWLKGVVQTFRNSIMGVVFCCTFDEAVKSNHLKDILTEL